MSHEIYYTSAPEGLKRGTSGFSTVGASEGIPKPLWDRLETLSAYRHQFAGGVGTNPVSLAHWILNLSGKTHHVLSRICDSGVDHTQRTNAFAHHLVVDHTEIEKAPGGPAWMLRQPGVMAEGWDGRVGSIGRIGLPKGDDYPASKVCRAWEAVTGDAGWGGHLADLFAKSPLRPVCMLFAAGQDVFALIDEAIALLPPAARWNVTFNTYFTSMPTSATCLWRCCLSGTQAAQVGLRYAASGLILDLTDRARLPALPAGPYVTMARTGRAVEAPRPMPVKIPAVDVKGRSGGPLKTPPVAGGDADTGALARDASERNRLQSEFDEMLEGVEPETETSAAAEDSAYEMKGGQVPAPSASTGRREGRIAPARIMQRASDALEAAERDAAIAAQRRRKQVMLLFAGALAAIAVGTGLVFFLNSRSGPPETPVKNPVTRAQPTTDAVVAVPDVTQPVAQTVVATATGPTIVETQPVPIVPRIPVVPTLTYPDTLVAQTMLERPNIGAGIGDRVQTLALRATDLDPAPVAEVRFAFPPTLSNKTPVPASTAKYVHETLGTLTAQAEVRAGKPGVALTWKGPNDAAAEALFMTFDRTGPMVEMRWKSSMLLKNPGSFSFVFWTLQNSTLELETPKAEKQGIGLKPFVPAAVSLTDAESNLTWPVELPRETTAAAPAVETLPAGWKAEWYPDWESKDPTQRKADNALQVIKFKKPTTTPAVDAWFLLTFSPGFKKVQSTYTKRLESDKKDLAQFESELRAIDSQIEEVKSRNNGTLGTSQGAQDMQTQHDQTAALVEAYKAAVAGYNELSKVDIALELHDEMRLTTLHFQTRDNETGK